MGKEKRGPLALELWAKQLIDVYPDVTIRNMTTSWRNGLAFCALIHRFRPDLIDYEKLDPSDIIGNCSLAFEIAETKLGIPSLLDPVDMEALEIPDRLSVLTYVAQFYNAFKNCEAKSPRISPSRREENDNDSTDSISKRSCDEAESPMIEKKVTKRKQSMDEDEIMDKVKRSMTKQSVLLSTANKCCKCGNPVFISERVLFMKKLYHRPCFSCFCCKNPLNPHLVDVSPDGSLFCLEKTCHAELLHRIEGPRSDNSNKNCNTNSMAKSSGNNSVTNCDVAVPGPCNPNSAGTADLNSDDSQSQGDMQTQIHTEPQINLGIPVHASPITTPKSSKKLMDFAGSLLHDNYGNENEEEAPSEEVIQRHEKDSNIPHSESPVQSCGDLSGLKENEIEKQNDMESNKTIEAKPEKVHEDISEVNVSESLQSSAEEICTGKNEELTVADQIRISLTEPTNDTIENPEINPLIEQSAISEDQQQKVPELGDTTSPVLKTEDDPEVIYSRIEVPQEPETASVTQIENVPEVTANSEPTEPLGPLEEEEEEDTAEKQRDISKESVDISSTPDATSSPIPKQRPPKPPPPKSRTTPSTSPAPSPIPRRSSPKKMQDSEGFNTDESGRNKDFYPAELNPFETEEDLAKPESKNPFEEDEEDDDPPPTTPVPKPRPERKNEEGDDLNNNSGRSSPRQNAANFNIPPPRPPPPVLSPRRAPPNPKPYNPFEDDEDDIGEYGDEEGSVKSRKPMEDASSISSKTSDLSSISGIPTPTPRSLNTSDTEGGGSVKVKSRKSKRAPLPPSMMANQTTPEAIKTTSPEKKIIPVSAELKKSPLSPRTQNTQRKKRRAPPPRRRVEPLPEEAIRREFEDLEVQLRELERQGITLETKIRSQMLESNDQQDEGTVEDKTESEAHPSEASPDAAEEMMIDLWNIVNEKNEILRRQTELEYLRRGHSLEEMQSELDFKLRVLMDTAEDQREPNHEDMEQALIQQLLKLVDERNEVVEWLDYHRQKDREEEMMVAKSISEFSAQKTVEPVLEAEAPPKGKEKKKKLKLGIFKKKSKKGKNVDVTDP